MPGSDALPNIQPMWQKVALRLQSVARMQEGVGIISINVIFKDGLPVHWSNPKLTLMEPKTNQDDLINLLRGDF